MAQTNEFYTAAQITKIFGLDLTKPGFYGLEDRGIIPPSKRLKRGKVTYRAWLHEDLPRIGSQVGFLRKPDSTKVVSVFALKGGTGKSTFAFQYARALALHNINTLVIGLDAQETITQALDRRANHLDPETTYPGICHVIRGEATLQDVIQQTDLPALHYIPETIDLSILDRVLALIARKEDVIKRLIIDPAKELYGYDVILFDCNPSWSDKVTGALAASDVLISPLGCDINSLRAAGIFAELLDEFQNAMQHQFQRWLILPTLLENNKLSQQVLAKYRIEYEQECTVSSIRRTVVVQEANAQGLSLMETSFKTPAYNDITESIKEVHAALLDAGSAQDIRMAG